MRPLQFSILIAFITLAAAPLRAQDEARRAAAFVDKGNELLSKGKYQDALSAYDEAKIAKPDSAEIAYDRGIALYRLKDYEKAEKAFQGALQPERPDIEAKAKFNLGRCAHEAAIAHVDKLDQAVNELGRAISFYGDALQLNAKDLDAQDNMAAAERLRAFLQKKLEEQKQKKQSPSSQPTSQPNQEPTSQPQQQQPSSQPSSQPQDQGDEEGEKKDEQQGQKDSEQESKDQKQEDDQKGQKGGKKDQKSDGEPQDEQQQAEDSEQKAGDEKQQQAQMSKEQTEAMLQEARDMEHQRREAKRARMMRIRGRAPVAKDW